MRHTEFWARMDDALGDSYARSWADLYVIADLGGRTASQAIEAGIAPKEVWAAVWRVLDLPASKR